MKIKTCSNKPLDSKGIREQPKILILLSNNQIIIGPYWWAFRVYRTGFADKQVVEVHHTHVRVNRVITTLNKLLENLETESNEN